jgi:ferritin-like metal-binding protein YciE
MKIKTLHELYVESLRDLYSAETQLVGALPKVAQAASNRDLKAAFEDHLKQTKGHVKRLDEVFEELGEKPTGHTCVAMKGLIKETEEVISDVADKTVLDAALIGAAQKVEHYEIAGYGTARTFAQLMGHARQAKLLQETLNEEGKADALLTRVAESVVNAKAEQTNPASMKEAGTTESLAGAGGSRRS